MSTQLLIIKNPITATWDRDNVGGIATRYGMDGPGSNPARARFSTPVQTGPGAHPASYTMGTGPLSRG